MRIVNAAKALRLPPNQQRKAPSVAPSYTRDLITRMAESHADLAAGRVDAGMRRIVDTLAALRSSLPLEQWRAVCDSPELRSIRSVLAEDPHAHRAYVKPRGYAGDPVLLDYIYGCAPLPEYTSGLGHDIYRWAAENSLAFRSVHQRRAFLAAMIDATAARLPKARVLAVACGHLREAQLSTAIVGRGLKELVAVDRDRLSLDVVRATCRGLPVRCVQATVADLITDRLDLGDFDLIYAAGLYDYLPDKVARRLTGVLSSRLRPGGELVVGNFAGCWESGYMEAIMNWFLLYRTETELLSVAGDIRDPVMRVWTDSLGVGRYLALTRC